MKERKGKKGKERKERMAMTTEINNQNESMEKFNATDTRGSNLFLKVELPKVLFHTQELCRLDDESNKVRTQIR